MNTTIPMNTETEQAIAAEAMAEIERRPTWQLDLVYVDYRDELDEEQVAMLVRGDWEAIDASMDDWVSEAQHEGARALLEDIVGDLDDWDESIRQDWLYTDEASEAMFEIMERDTSTPLKDLASHSGNAVSYTHLTLPTSDLV